MPDPIDLIRFAIGDAAAVDGSTIDVDEAAWNVLRRLRDEYGVAPNPNRIGFAIPVPDWDLADAPEEADRA